jgi:23S rRNA (pseudouridine1915-N3)-methyltransferase
MHVSVLAIGGRPRAWVAAAWDEYARRLPQAWKTELVEIPAARRSPRQPVAEVRSAEAERVRAAVKSGERLVALDERGRLLDSEGFAGHLDGWLAEGRDIVFLIGGAEGLDRELLARADFRWSLSPLTLPHEMVRMVLAEQLYRASTIIAGHPYHRGG